MIGPSTQKSDPASGTDPLLTRGIHIDPVLTNDLQDAFLGRYRKL